MIIWRSWWCTQRGWLVFRYMYTDGYDVPEVAAALQTNPQVVYNWRHRIRKEARAFFESEPETAS